MILATGGIGANHEMLRRLWPARLGQPPATMVTGVLAHVDGRMLDIAASSGVRLVNRDRMWHYTEGVQNCFPGYDTLGTLRYLRTTADLAGHDHSWFILTQKILRKEFALSGSEQNPDITNRDRQAFLRTRLLSRRRAAGPVEAFKDHGADFVVAGTLEDLVANP